jgi:hypothetical protein
MRDRFFKNPFSRAKGGFKSEKYKQSLISVDEDINRIVLLTHQEPPPWSLYD